MTPASNFSECSLNGSNAKSPVYCSISGRDKHRLITGLHCIRLHRGRSDGEGRNNPNHLGWFIGWLHAMAALDRNHERTPACMLDQRLSVHLRARFQFPKTRILPCHHAPLVYGMQSTRDRRLLSVARWLRRDEITQVPKMMMPDAAPLATHGHAWKGGGPRRLQI